jgi:predicted AAA+ superfamily ATPase
LNSRTGFQPAEKNSQAGSLYHLFLEPLLAHNHGQFWNAAELARALAVSGSTVRRCLDLLLFKRGRRIGVECKRANAPTLTPSMRIALTDLTLDELYVVYPGEKHYPLAKNVEAVTLSQLVNAK